jgi:hypothetical protein
VHQRATAGRIEVRRAGNTVPGPVLWPIVGRRAKPGGAYVWVGQRVMHLPGAVRPRRHQALTGDMRPSNPTPVMPGSRSVALATAGCVRNVTATPPAARDPRQISALQLGCSAVKYAGVPGRNHARFTQLGPHRGSGRAQFQCIKLARNVLRRSPLTPRRTLSAGCHRRRFSAGRRLPPNGYPTSMGGLRTRLRPEH